MPDFSLSKPRKGTRTAYKLFRVRRDKTLGSLFINREAVIPIGVWLESGDFPTAGYARRPGYHAAPKPEAAHLHTKGRVWMEVRVRDYQMLKRPQIQGGAWFLAKWMKVIGPVKGIECKSPVG